MPDNKICVCIVKIAFGKVRPRPHKVKCGIGGQRLAGMKIPKPRVDEHKGVFPCLGGLVKRQVAEKVQQVRARIFFECPKPA